MPSDFSKSSRDIRLTNGHCLEAQCARINGDYVASSIDLDQIFGYKNGEIVPGSRDFSRDVGKPLKLGEKPLTIDYLDQHIGNIDGKLKSACEQDYCTVCQNFPTVDTKFEITSEDLKRSLSKCPTCHIINELRAKLQSENSASTNADLKKIIGMVAESTDSGFPEIVFRFDKAERTFVLYLEQNGKRSVWFLPLYCSTLTSTETLEGVPQFEGLRRAAHIPASMDAMGIAREWINDCANNHKKCSSTHTLSPESTPESVLPARVIDMGKSPTDQLRLRLGNGEKATYACLSHCWGASQPLTLRRDNIDSLKSGFDRKSLQKVYREAIWFCQQLGIRYIW